MEEKLIAYIRREFVTDDSAEITADTPLISSGLIDSFSIVSLLSFIDRTFGKKLPPALITADSFDSVRRIVDLIQAA